jgi:conjugal transfer pilus assembly protein TraV
MARALRGMPATFAILAGLTLGGCSTIGSLMSPYSEKFSCKNSDHGQCIHPDQAYADAVAGRASRSTPAVTRDRRLLRPDAVRTQQGKHGTDAATAYAGYRDSVYRELKGLIDAPVTPMLKPALAVRTLILPYADRQRPDRLYMPRYVYAIVDRPAWVVGGYLVEPLSAAAQAPVLGQVREKPLNDDAPAAETGPDSTAPRP